MWSGQRVSALIGYRYLRSSDTLWITDTATALVFGTFTPTDNFKAASNFHGLDLGLTGEWRNGPWSLEWRGKVALGANLNTADISGSTTSTFAGHHDGCRAASSRSPATAAISRRPASPWCRSCR